MVCLLPWLCLNENKARLNSIHNLMFCYTLWNTSVFGESESVPNLKEIKLTYGNINAKTMTVKTWIGFCAPHKIPAIYKVCRKLDNEKKQQ